MSQRDDRSDRLRTLVEDIHRRREAFDCAAMKLKEIRDDELYKEDGFATWEKYLRERWDLPENQVSQMIRSAEYRQMLREVEIRVKQAAKDPEESQR